jgi:phosphoribosylformimino-5-aminoimidazole carboxamide ribotide isomerase
MIIFPAVDIKNGQAVRLRRGRADNVTVFSDNPVMMALHWQQLGAKYLHVVDLDAAFDGDSQNEGIIRSICSNLSIPVQLGGGIRSESIARKWLDFGVSRLIVGTIALEEPQRFASLCAAFPGRIGVALDSRGGKLKTRGWTADSGQTEDDVLPRLVEAGVGVIICTDIDRDGIGGGINFSAIERLAQASAVPVIASGGVSSMADIEELYRLSLRANLEGVVVGRALYENMLDLSEVTRWIAAQA